MTTATTRATVTTTSEHRYTSPTAFKRAWRHYTSTGRRVVACVRWADGTLGLVVATRAAETIPKHRRATQRHTKRRAR